MDVGKAVELVHAACSGGSNPATITGASQVAESVAVFAVAGKLFAIFDRKVCQPTVAAIQQHSPQTVFPPAWREHQLGCLPLGLRQAEAVFAQTITVLDRVFVPCHGGGKIPWFTKDKPLHQPPQMAIASPPTAAAPTMERANMASASGAVLSLGDPTVVAPSGLASAGPMLPSLPQGN